MKLHIKNILFICASIPGIIYGAEQCEASSSSSAHSRPAISASSSAPASQSTHPLAKIFPINLPVINELEGEIEKMSPDLKYIATYVAGQDGPLKIYDVSIHEIILHLDAADEFNNDFTVLITKEKVQDNEAVSTFLFNFYDFQEKKANLSIEPFFTIEGHASYISPNGHYVAITRTINNNFVTSLYDIQSRRHLNPDNVLFNINSAGWFNFSSDSKMIAVKDRAKVEIIDIESGINMPLAPSKMEFIPINVNAEHLSLSKKFKYAIHFKPLQKRISIYDVQTKMTNPQYARLAELQMPDATAILGSDAKFLALTTNDITNIYDFKSLAAQAPGAPFYSIQNPPLYSIPGGKPVLISPDNTHIITTNKAHSINILNTFTGKLAKNIKTFNPLFSKDSKLLLAPFEDTTVYNLENDIPLIKVKGQAEGLNTETGILITKNRTLGLGRVVHKILFYDVSFLNNPTIKKILDGKLSLAQQAFIALLDKYYGNPISLAEIAQAENMGEPAVNGVLRLALASFPEIIKGAIIKTYQIADPEISKQEIEESKAQRRTLKAKFAQEREQEAGREQLIHKALESKNKGKK